MAKQIARLLKADIQESSDLKSIAKMLSKKGRGGDTMLAHITPKEAKILKEAGGAGTVNPDTGLLEFFDLGDYAFGADYADYVRPTKTYTAEMPTQQPVFDVTQYQAPGGYQAYAAPAAGYFDESAFSDLPELQLQQAAEKQYSGSAFPYTPGGNYQYVGQDVDGQFIKEFPAEMTYSRSNIVGAPAAAAYPQGMMDIPADVGAATRPAIPGIPPGLPLEQQAAATQPGLADRKSVV